MYRSDAGLGCQVELNPQSDCYALAKDEVDLTRGNADRLRSVEILKAIRQPVAYVDPLASAETTDQLFSNEQRMRFGATIGLAHRYDSA